MLYGQKKKKNHAVAYQMLNVSLVFFRAMMHTVWIFSEWFTYWLCLHALKSTDEINLSCLILVWISSTDGMATDVLLYLLLKTNLVVLQIQRWLTWGCLLVSVSVVYIKIYIYEFPICTIYYWWDVFRSHSLTRENICQSVPLI